uniref:Uncharacterized protein n=1 Tax=Lotharella oceanica TaxID=641309 RepID=A0A7S2TW09_9EUKA|mmetsp:Transcript_3235/g.6291  ORF Transcript_3235/g.6291 Transcript_3235/m.6291 type:complete len:209 (+) Transcript_3235:123-749(+)
MHVAVEPGVQMSVGIELMPVRWQLSLINLRETLANCKTLKDRLKPNIAFTQGDVTAVKCLDPFTHIYMYDIAFTPQVMRAVSEAFNSSSTPRYLISYHKPRTIILKHGFLVNLVTYVPNTSMMGSRQKRTAWVYKRTHRSERNHAADDAKGEKVLQESIKVLKRSTRSTYEVWLNRTLKKTLYVNEGVNPREKRCTGKPFYRGCLVPW